MNQATVTGDRARRLPPWAGPWVRGTAGVVVFLLLAEAAGRLGIISRSALPLTSSVLARVVLLAGNTRFLADFGATVEARAVGMAAHRGVPAGPQQGRGHAPDGIRHPVTLGA
jgi:ABC-type nitrate/sulfonate/bicarbonate transport system permease component